MTNTATVEPRSELTNARARIVGTRDGVLADAIVALVRVDPRDCGAAISRAGGAG